MNTTKSDQELREVVSNRWDNGTYAYSICRNCESHYFHPDGDTRTAKITNVCRNCFDETD